MPRPLGLAKPLGRPRPRVAVLPLPAFPRTDGKRDCRDVVLVCLAAGFDVVGGLSTNEVSVVLKLHVSED
jgi:hypothetical protein